MKSDLWCEGLIVEIDINGESARLSVRSIREDTLRLQNITSGEIIDESIEVATAKLESGEIKVLRDDSVFGNLVFNDLSLAEQREVVRRKRYVIEYRKSKNTRKSDRVLDPLIKSVSKNISDDKPPSFSAYRRWLNSYENSGFKINGLYPKHRNKGNTSSRIDPRIVLIIDRLSKRYYTQSQPRMKSMWREVEAKVIEHNLYHPDDILRVPVYNTVRDRINKISAYEKARLRGGKHTTSQEFDIGSEKVVTTAILQRVEADHTDLDIEVLHDEYGTKLGRPFISALIDHYSGMPLGIMISFVNPSYAVVSHLIRDGVFEKDKIISEYSIDGRWPARGVMQEIVFDNGKEFWCENIDVACDDIGVIVQYCKIRHGKQKSCVERFFGTVNTELLDRLPGVVRKKGKAGEDYKSSRRAKIKFSEFKKIFYTWLVEVYCKTPRGEQEKSPLMIWNESESDNPIPEESKTDILPKLLSTKTKRLGREGIHIFSMKWQSRELNNILRRDGPRDVTVKFDEFDIGTIYVLDDYNKVYIEVLCKNPLLIGMSYYEYRIVRAMASNNRKPVIEDIDLQRSKVKLANMIDETHDRNFRRKQQKSVRKSARIEKIGIETTKLSIVRSVDPDQDEDDELDMDGWDLE